MAATKSQGNAFMLFVAGITITAAGIAYFSSGGGKLGLIVGLVVLIASLAISFKIKPQEGKIPANAQPTILKIAGVGLAVLGWVVVLFGLYLSPSVTGRMVSTLVGLAITLTGVIGLLPAAANKNAIWKA